MELKTKYRFIQFIKATALNEGIPNLFPSPILWICRNKKSEDILGVITFYESWKQHVIDFKPDCVFNNQCMNDIADFLDQLNKQRMSGENATDGDSTDKN